MKEELRVPWNCSESHLPSVSSSHPYAQVEKRGTAALRGPWRWKPASLTLHCVIWDKTPAKCFCDLCLLISVWFF